MSAELNLLFLFLGAVVGFPSGWILGKVIHDLGANKPYKALIYTCAGTFGFWVGIGFSHWIGYYAWFIATPLTCFAVPLLARVLEMMDELEEARRKAAGIEQNEDPNASEKFFIGLGAAVGTLSGAVCGLVVAHENGLTAAILSLTIGAPIIGILAVGNGLLFILTVEGIRIGAFQRAVANLLTGIGSRISRALGAK